MPKIKRFNKLHPAIPCTQTLARRELYVRRDLVCVCVREYGKIRCSANDGDAMHEILRLVAKNFLHYANTPFVSLDFGIWMVRRAFSILIIIIQRKITIQTPGRQTNIKQISLKKKPHQFKLWRDTIISPVQTQGDSIADSKPPE